MANEEDSENTINRLRHELQQTKDRARDFEDKMMKAAMYGKELLDNNVELESLVEKARQEKHELSLRLVTKTELERSLLQELEFLRDSLKGEERKMKAYVEEEADRLSKKENEWKERLVECEQELEQVQAREKRLQELLSTLEKQMEESNSTFNKSLTGESLSCELETVQRENCSLLQERQSLHLDLARSREELELLRGNLRVLEARLEAQVRDLENLQCEMSGYMAAADNHKMEMLDLQAQLDAERAGSVLQDGKGNSLFSEVEDRRQRVEGQLSNLNNKYETIKEVYDSKVLELQKVKMHNSQLLSIAGSRTDTEHVNRLEELLSQEKEKVRLLMEKLDTMDQLTIANPQPPTSCSIPNSNSQVSQETGLMETESSGCESAVPNIQSTEYMYMSHMVEQAEQKNKQLQQQLREQVREMMAESDKQRELCRKLHNADQNINKLKAENYSIKIQLEEANGNKSGKKVVKTKKIVEQINFLDEEKENTGEDTKPEFLIKETVKTGFAVSKRKSTESEAVGKGEECEKEEREQEAEGEGRAKKKKGIVLCDKVMEIGVNGETVEKDLVDQAKEKMKAKKPIGGRKIKGGGEVTRVQEDPECKQQ